MFSIELAPRAQKFLSKLDSHLRERLESGLRKLKTNPIPPETKFIMRHEGEKVFRYRIGNYRALYKVKESVVLVTKIDKRPRVYRR